VILPIGWRHGFTFLRVVVSFSYGSVLEAVVCIQVYYFLWLWIT